MKKLLLVLFAFLAVTFMTVFDQSEAITPTEDTMVINIKNHANFKINMFEIQTAYGGGGMGYADGSRIKRGDVLSMIYIDQEDFELKGTGTFDFFAIGEDQQRVYLGTQTLALKPNHAYQFKVTGRTAEKAKIIRIEDKD